jgi:RNA polymerase sigma-70 factor (family 1)
MDISSAQNEFRLIYEEHYNSLCRAAYRILKEKEGAREVVQQVFLDLWTKANWNDLQSVKGYLYVSVYNRSINFIDKRKRFVSEESIPEILEHHQAEVELEELRNAIHLGIEALPDRCKEVFLLSREDEMTYQQIANHLGLSIKTVERHMGIALHKLREYLDVHWSG